jgi:hypothetical protein
MFQIGDDFQGLVVFREHGFKMVVLMQEKGFLGRDLLAGFAFSKKIEDFEHGRQLIIIDNFGVSVYLLNNIKLFLARLL